MPLCRAKRTNGSPCRQYAIRGGTVCRSHGGSARQVRKKAAENVAADRARKLLRREGVEPIQDVFAEMLLLAGETKAIKDALAESGEDAAFERYADRFSRLLRDIAATNAETRIVRVQEATVAPFVESLISFAFKFAEELGLDPGDVRTRAAINSAFRTVQTSLTSSSDFRPKAIDGAVIPGQSTREMTN